MSFWLNGDDTAFLEAEILQVEPKDRLVGKRNGLQGRKGGARDEDLRSTRWTWSSGKRIGEKEKKMRKISGIKKKTKKCEGLTELEGQEPMAREEDIVKHFQRSLCDHIQKVQWWERSWEWN